jgi:hypothetical protein
MTTEATRAIAVHGQLLFRHPSKQVRRILLVKSNEAMKTDGIRHRKALQYRELLLRRSE